MYDADSLRELLRSLQAEGVEALLFLKSIQRLEVHEWRQGGAGPSLLHSCSLSDASPETLSQRRFFLRAALGPAGDGAADASSYVATFESRSAGVQGDAVTQRAFLVRQACGGGASRTLAAEAAQAFNVQVVPYAAVAAALPDRAAAAEQEGQESRLQGRAFCFLAITKTGLPVHVNGEQPCSVKPDSARHALTPTMLVAPHGKEHAAHLTERCAAGFFELSSNRRDVWHGSGMAGVGQLRCDWNLCLLKVRADYRTGISCTFPVLP